MFGVMDLETGRCRKNNWGIEPYFKKYLWIDDNDIAVWIDDNDIAVPKDYINHWASGHKCEHDGCMDDGSVECRLPNDAHLNPDADIGEVMEHFCPDHAFKNGYCVCCGDFFGGIEDFDFGNGLCDNCKDAIDCEQERAFDGGPV